MGCGALYVSGVGKKNSGYVAEYENDIRRYIVVVAAMRLLEWFSGRLLDFRLAFCFACFYNTLSVIAF